MTYDIPQTDPKANYLAHRVEIDAAIKRVLESGRYILGEQVVAFEEAFAAYIGVGYGVGVGSGTEALHIALLACGIEAGDPVFTVSHTAVATVAAIEMCRAHPVLVDVDPETLTLDPARLRDAIRQTIAIGDSAGRARRGAVVPVHLYGQPAAMAEINEIADHYGLWVVEDCAQSHGATIDGRKTGSLGHIAAFSFYPTKNLGALGDGGMIVTDDPKLAERARLLRQYGWKERYVSAIPGLNSRLDPLQAAVLWVKLPYLDQENERRRELATIYRTMLSGTAITLPRVPAHTVPVYHQFVIRTEERDALRAYLAKRGIGTLIHYPVPVHLQPAYTRRVTTSDAMTVTEACAHQILSLPIYPELPESEVRAVAQEIIRWAGRTGQPQDQASG